MIDVFDSMEYRENRHTARQKSGLENYNRFGLYDAEIISRSITTNDVPPIIAKEVGGKSIETY